MSSRLTFYAFPRASWRRKSNRPCAVRWRSIASSSCFPGANARPSTPCPPPLCDASPNRTWYLTQKRKGAKFLSGTDFTTLAPSIGPDPPAFGFSFAPQRPCAFALTNFPPPRASAFNCGLNSPAFLCFLWLNTSPGASVLTIDIFMPFREQVGEVRPTAHAQFVGDPCQAHRGFPSATPPPPGGPPALDKY